MLFHTGLVDAQRVGLESRRKESDAADDMHRHRAEMARERIVQPPRTIVQIAKHAALVIVA